MSTFVRKQESVYFTLFDTPFGPARLIWGLAQGGLRIFRLFLPSERPPARSTIAAGHPDAEDRSCADINALITQVERFFQGEEVVFPLEILNLEACTLFQQAVLRAEHAIPRGWVSTYGRLARQVGSPGAARAVGQALSRNPFPILIPCHRALRSDGQLGGFQGGLAMKRALLELEGVMISPAGKVVDPQYCY